jgi:hypothetical protein
MAMARVFNSQPDVVVFDKPDRGLDVFGLADDSGVQRDSALAAGN